MMAGAVVDRRMVRGLVPLKTQAIPVKQAVLGGAVRADSIPAGSKLEYLGPGRVRFDGVEFRAVRDLSHLSEGELRVMALKGKAPKDLITTKPLEGHHHRQQFHRNPNSFIVEIPEHKHTISNPNQHPLGISGGLTASERSDWDKLRKQYWKERAKTELLKRGEK